MPSWVRSSLSPPTRKKGRAQVRREAEEALVPRHKSFLRFAAAAGNQLAQRFIAALVQGLGCLLAKFVHIVLYLSIQ